MKKTTGRARRAIAAFICAAAVLAQAAGVPASALPKTLNLAVGELYGLPEDAEAVRRPDATEIWRTNPTATVKTNGRLSIRGDAEGSERLVVIFSDGREETVEARVAPAVVKELKLETLVGNRLRLPSSYASENGGRRLTWTDAETDGYSISDGRFEAKKPGTYEFFGRTGGNLARCVVEATDKPVVERMSEILYVGETLRMKTTITVGTTEYAASWADADFQAGTLKSGAFEAKKPGTAVLTGECSHGKAEATVVVKAKSDSEKSETILIGESLKLPEKIGTERIEWKNAETPEYSVRNGIFLGKKAGTRTVEGKSRAGTARVRIAVKNLPVLERAERKGFIGNEIELPKTAIADGRKLFLEWTEADGAAYSLKKGKFVGKKAGTYVLTGKCPKGLVKCSVKVEKMKIVSTARKKTYVGLPTALPQTAKTSGKTLPVKWTEADGAAYSLKKGMFTAKKARTFVIKGRTDAGYFSYEIAAEKPPVIESRTVSIPVGGSVVLPKTVKRRGRTLTVSWSVPSSKNFSVSGRTVKALKAGTILAKGICSDGEIRRRIKATACSIEPESPVLYGAGAELKLSVKGTDAKPKWRIVSEGGSSIVSIANDGTVRAKKAGRAVAEASIGGAKIYVCVVVEEIPYGEGSKSEKSRMTTETADGIRICMDSAIPKSARTALRSALLSIPKKYRKNVRCANFLAEDAYAVAERRSGLSETVGYASGKLICVCWFPSWKNQGLYSPTYNLYHEVGHTLDPTPKGRLSETAEWRSIADAEWRGESHYEYGSYSEAFAEAFKLYYLNRLSGRPRTKAFLSKNLG